MRLLGFDICNPFWSIALGIELGKLADLRGRMLPPSSRSFHELFAEILWLHDDVRALRNETAMLREEIATLRKEASVKLDAHDTHSKMMLWPLLALDGETEAETKLRFFRNLPKAQGDFRLLQMGCAQLLFEFDDVCKVAGVEYMLMYGSLLGAVRHEGFIPWDDDLDVCMTRGDITRLMASVEDDSRYQITERFDWYAHCRQIRFKYNDVNNPCFIDLFILDYASSVSDSSFERLLEVRRKMIREMDEREDLRFWQEEERYLDASSERAGEIDEIFRRYQQMMADEGLYVSKDEAVGLNWGIDNCYFEGNGNLGYSFAELYPLLRVPFEGHMLLAPANCDSVLRHSYGDYLELPDDIHSHFHHVPREMLSNEAVRNAIRSSLPRSSIL